MNDHGLSSAFEQLDEAHRFSGTVLVAEDGDVVFERAYGFASRQLGVANALDTKFAIASLTKMFTAMAVLGAVDPLVVGRRTLALSRV